MSQVHVDLLTTAKVRIQSGEVKYICYALHDVARSCWNKKDYQVAAEEIDRYISESLGDYAFASSWLYDTIRPNEDCVDWYFKNSEAIQEWRCRWIDQMIEIFRDAP